MLGASVWKEKGPKNIMFCSANVRRHFHRRVAKATCTKYRTCEQNLSAVFRSFPTTGPRPLISNTARTPTDKSVWGMFETNSSRSCRWNWNFETWLLWLMWGPEQSWIHSGQFPSHPMLFSTCKNMCLMKNVWFHVKNVWKTQLFNWNRPNSKKI